MAFHPYQIYGPLPGGVAQRLHPSLDADGVFLPWSSSGVACSCHGTCGVGVDDERRAGIAVVHIPKKGSFDGCNLRVERGRLASTLYAP
jgi:hypothetical protein